MTKLALLFALAVPVALGTAQVSVSIDALSPLAATCTTPGISVTDSRLAGPRPLNEFLVADIPNVANAVFSYSCSADTTGVYFSLVQSGFATVASPSGTSAVAGPAELLLTVQSATLQRVALTVVFDDTTQPGAQQPTALVDVGNDGLYEFVNGQQAVALPPLVIGPQPLLVRVRTEARALPGEVSSSNLGILIAPTNELDLATAALGCAGPLATLALRRSFVAQGLELTASSQSSSLPVFAVFGFGAQPALLPSFGSAPCLLLPTPDIIVPIASNATLSVGLPPALRPLTFWVQGVAVVPQLLTTDCTRVDAF